MNIGSILKIIGAGFFGGITGTVEWGQIFILDKDGWRRKSEDLFGGLTRGEATGSKLHYTLYSRAALGSDLNIDI
jgi:hypothetical protein